MKIDKIAKALIFLSIFLLFLLNFGSYIYALPNTQEAEPKSAFFSRLAFNSPTFLKISNNNSNPTPQEAINVSSVIYDDLGINNATLFWTYNSINTTVFNTPMVKISNLVDSSSNFPVNGYLFDNETKTNASTSRRFGEYTFEIINGDFISNFGATITSGGGNSLVYLQIDVKYINSNEWNTVFALGDINSTNQIGPITYNDFNISAGYKVFAVNYKANSPSIPNLDVNIYEEFYSGIILPSYQPSNVLYYIKSFNTVNTFSQSSDFNLIMNSLITFQINEIPDEVTGENFFVNISLTDLDGVDNINHSSVKAIYSVTGVDEISIPLDFIRNVDSKTAIFAGQIFVGDLRSPINKTLTLYFEANDIILTKSGNFEVILVGDPTLTSSSSFSSSSKISSSSHQSSTSSEGEQASWYGVYAFLAVIILTFVNRKHKSIK